MRKFKSNEKIEVLGTTFNGVKDIWEHAISGEPNNGVYVAEDSEHYPCFDSSDYSYENRYYCNFIFSRDKDELAKKLKELKAMRQLSSNYNKLTQTFHPMAYWEGDKHHDVYITEGDDLLKRII